MKLPSFLAHAPLKVYESHLGLGCFAPIPFSSVELSEQYDSLQGAGLAGLSSEASGLTQELARAYLMYRLGRVQAANWAFKAAVGRSTEELKRFALWGIAVTATVQKDYAESNEILKYLRRKFTPSQLEWRALSYWITRNRIGLEGKDLELGEILEGLTCKETSWQLFDLYCRHSSFNRGAAIRLLDKWDFRRDGTYLAEKWLMRLGLGDRGEENSVFKHGAFALDHHSMLEYLDRYGADVFLAGWRQVSGGVPHTSEVLAALALHSTRFGGLEQFRELYTEDRIIHLGRLELADQYQEELVFESITSELGIRDFNTSDFGGRTYTLNLSKKRQFESLDRSVRACVSDRKESLVGLMPHLARTEVAQLETWFDASFTSGGSNIFPHLHTPGSYKTYYFTVVFYAQVPAEMKTGEGDLTFLDTDIAAPEYQKTPLKKRVKVSTGDLYAFPSYFFHATTPSNTQQVRLTFNFDFYSTRRSLCLQ